jgi:hypothetical protein
MTIEVIGAGYGRTGTLSLKLALEQLGFAPCHHMVEVFKNPPSMAWWEAAADGNPDWPKIFEGFKAAVDWPTATFYKELADFYPDAKVVLTVRDPQSWFESTQATIFANGFDGDGAGSPIPGAGAFLPMARAVVGRLFDQQMHDREKLLEVYNRHNETVQRVIPAERLLVYHVSDGWAPLCEFLGVPVPDGPTPRVNDRESFPRTVSDHADSPASA